MRAGSAFLLFLVSLTLLLAPAEINDQICNNYRKKNGAAIQTCFDIDGNLDLLCNPRNINYTRCEAQMKFGRGDNNPKKPFNTVNTKTFSPPFFVGSRGTKILQNRDERSLRNFNALLKLNGIGHHTLVGFVHLTTLNDRAQVFSDGAFCFQLLHNLMMNANNTGIAAYLVTMNASLSAVKIEKRLDTSASGTPHPVVVCLDPSENYTNEIKNITEGANFFLTILLSAGYSKPDSGYIATMLKGEKKYNWTEIYNQRKLTMSFYKIENGKQIGKRIDHFDDKTHKLDKKYVTEILPEHTNPMATVFLGLMVCIALFWIVTIIATGIIVYHSCKGKRYGLRKDTFIPYQTLIQRPEHTPRLNQQLALRPSRTQIFDVFGAPGGYLSANTYEFQTFDYKGGVVDLVIAPNLHSQMTNKFRSKSTTKQIQKHISLRHPNVVQVLGICLDSPEPGVVLEKCAMGSLHQMLRYCCAGVVLEKCAMGSLHQMLSSQAINWVLQLSLLYDLADGLAYLHDHLGPHGTLWSGSCLIDNTFALKIRVNQLVEGPEDIEKYSYREMWQAPEFLKRPGMKASLAGDVYAYGIIAHEIAFRKGPFAMGLGFYKMHSQGKAAEANYFAHAMHHSKKAMESEHNRPDTSDGVVREIYKSVDIMKSCWKDDPRKRLKSKEIIASVRQIARDNHVRTSIRAHAFAKMHEYAMNVAQEIAQSKKAIKETQMDRERLLDRVMPREIVEMKVFPDWVSQLLFFTHHDQTLQANWNEAKPYSQSVGFKRYIELFDEVATLSGQLATMYGAKCTLVNRSSFMVVTGCPAKVRTSQHVTTLALTVLHIHEGVRRKQLELAERNFRPIELHLRSGMHTGSVMAGIVGASTSYHYTIFSDTVNVAARMMQTGKDDMIQITGDMQKVLDKIGTFGTEFRGKVNIKNLGIIETYFLRNYKNMPKVVKYDVRLDGCGWRQMAPVQASGNSERSEMSELRT